MMWARVMSMVSEGLVIRNRDQASGASHSLSELEYSVSSSSLSAICMLGTVWAWLPCYRRGNTGEGGGCDAGGKCHQGASDASLSCQIKPSQRLLGSSGSHGSESGLCLLLCVCRAALGTSTLHHVLITTEQSAAATRPTPCVQWELEILLSHRK